MSTIGELDREVVQEVENEVDLTVSSIPVSTSLVRTLDPSILLIPLSFPHLVPQLQSYSLASPPRPLPSSLILESDPSSPMDFDITPQLLSDILALSVHPAPVQAISALTFSDLIAAVNPAENPLEIPADLNQNIGSTEETELHNNEILRIISENGILLSEGNLTVPHSTEMEITIERPNPKGNTLFSGLLNIFKIGKECSSVIKEYSGMMIYVISFSYKSEPAEKGK